MTIRLFHDDSYLQTFSARVSRLDPDQHAIALDQTAFFPGGGGQPHDQGVLSFEEISVPIQKVKVVSGEIFHFLPEDQSLPSADETITGELDWDRRYKLMRTHTAMHVLCGTIFRDYGASVTGGNMEPLKGRMDFEFASLEKELVKTIEDAVNTEIEKALPVTWRTIPRDEAFAIPDLIRTKINLLPAHIKEVRVVEIAGLDLQADGGTHVRNTSEVGQVRIPDYKSKGKENKRIYLELLDS